MTDEQRGNAISGDMSELLEIAESFQRTTQFVPEYLEDTRELTKRERQILFHTVLVDFNLKTRKEKMKSKPNNFDNNTKMGGGINQGMNISKAEKNEYKQPEIFQDDVFILDSKMNDNTMVREMFKGINVNSVLEGEATEAETAEFFSRLNDKSNVQDEAEINEAAVEVEVLSGLGRDSLFQAQDLTTTRGSNQPRFNGAFQSDVPDNVEYQPAPINRGRNAQALEDVDPEAIERENRIDGVTTIAHSIGILGSAYRGIFGKNDIPSAHKNDMTAVINQNMRMMGKRGLYGDDKSLGTDDELYEGLSWNKRVQSMDSFSDNRDYKSMNSVRNPELLAENAVAQKDNQLSQALMFNKGTGVAGTALPQLREQEFGYKQAGRKVAHDGYAFMKGGNATTIKIANEFNP